MTEELSIFEKAVNDCTKYVVQKAIETEKTSSVSAYAVIKATIGFLQSNVLLKEKKSE